MYNMSENDGRNEKGKQIRKYFIEVEKEFNSPDKIMARGLLIADKTIKEQKTLISNLEYKIEKDKNKVEFQYKLFVLTIQILHSSPINRDSQNQNDSIVEDCISCLIFK